MDFTELAKPKVEVNLPLESLYANIRANSGIDVPWVKQLPPHDKTAVLVGGGPSLSRYVDEIKWHQDQGHHVFGLNKAAQFLVSKGCIPDHQVIIDARPESSKLVCGGLESYLVSSQVDPSMFWMPWEKVVLFHPVIPDVEKHILDKREYALIGGGLTVGLASLALGYTLGFRKFHIFGYDSSLESGKHHAYPQDRTPQENQSYEVVCGGRRFLTTPVLLAQAQAFLHLSSMLMDLDCTIAVHGHGLLPTMVRMMMGTAIPNGPLQLSYDLKTYPKDGFVEWLLNAESFRKANNFNSLMVKIDGLDGTEWNYVDSICRPAIEMIGATMGGDGSYKAGLYTTGTIVETAAMAPERKTA